MRRTRVHALAVAAVVAVTAWASACGEESAGESSSAAGESAAEPAPFSQRPYMGVSCPEPNSIACDRVGLSVWLREPAMRVEASIDGRQFALDDDDWSEAPDTQGRRRVFAGFLQPAGLTEPGSVLHVEPEAGDHWIGQKPVSATVELDITYSEDEHVGEEVTVPLLAGWG